MTIMRRAEVYLLYFNVVAPMNYIIANPSWIFPRTIEPITIYYQGILNSQVQCTKYIGPQTLPITTGEIAWCTRNINAMLHPFIGVELDDVHPACPDQKQRWYHYLNPSHWITFWLYKRSQCDNKYATITIENPTPEKKLSHTLSHHSVALTSLCFGQERDIMNHKRRWDSCQKQFSQNPKILYGASRGAGTTFNALSYYRTQYTNVALVILEGCYDTIFNTLSDRMTPFAKKLGLHKKIHSLISIFTDYNPLGISPLKSVSTFPEKIPVVFITSKIDSVVPPQRTRHLAQTLAARGKNDVYLIELSHSTHKGYTVDNVDDRKLYQNALHAIYKKYELPYIQEYAEEYQNRVNEFLVKV